MDARAEQLVLDYLRRLEDAARSRLGAAERMAFMARSRAAVAREIGETRADGADDVRGLLRRFGDPDRLAARERQRLDRLGGPASAAGDGTGQDGTGQDSTGSGRSGYDSPGHDGRGHEGYGHEGCGHDGLTHDRRGQGGAAAGDAGQGGSRRGGSLRDGALRDGALRDGALRDGALRDGSLRDGSLQAGAQQNGRLSGTGEVPRSTAEAPSAADGGQPGAAGAPGAARRAEPTSGAPSRWSGERKAPATAQQRRPGAAPALHRPMTARWRPGQRPDQASAADGAAGPAPSLPLVSRWPRPVARPAPAGAPGSAATPGSGRDNEYAPAGGGWEPGATEPDPAGPGWLAGLLAVVRKHPLECVAILLIALGGLIDPWPLWPVGALAMLASPAWGVRDKLAAVVIPLGFALIGAITLAGFSAHPPGLSGYAHEVHVEGWSLLRAGAVLGAAYLARRLQRGPRSRREPPWRRVPPAGR